MLVYTVLNPLLECDRGECGMSVSNLECVSQCFKHSNVRCKSSDAAQSSAKSPTAETEMISQIQLITKTNSGPELRKRQQESEKWGVENNSDWRQQNYDEILWDEADPTCQGDDKRIKYWCGHSDSWSIDHLLTLPAINPWFSSMFNAGRIQRISRHLCRAEPSVASWGRAETGLTRAGKRRETRTGMCLTYLKRSSSWANIKARAARANTETSHWKLHKRWIF